MTVIERLKALPWPLFVLVYVGVYGTLIGIGTVVSFLLNATERSVEAFSVEAVLAAAYLVPASVIPFAVALSVLYLFRDARRPWFRVAALVLCCLPSMCTPQWRQLAYFLPIQVFVALLVRQPYDPKRDRVGEHG